MTLLKRLKNSELFWKYKVDEDNRLNILFFAYSKSIKIAKTNNDVMLLDCIYKINKYGISLFNIYVVTAFYIII